MWLYKLISLIFIFHTFSLSQNFFFLEITLDINFSQQLFKMLRNWTNISKSCKEKLAVKIQTPDQISSRQSLKANHNFVSFFKICFVKSCFCCNIFHLPEKLNGWYWKRNFQRLPVIWHLSTWFITFPPGRGRRRAKVSPKTSHNIPC